MAAFDSNVNVVIPNDVYDPIFGSTNLRSVPCRVYKESATPPTRMTHRSARNELMISGLQCIIFYKSLFLTFSFRKLQVAQRRHKSIITIGSQRWTQ